MRARKAREGEIVVGKNKDIVLFAKLLSACAFGNGRIDDSNEINWDFVFAAARKSDVLSLLLPAFRMNGGVRPENLALVEKRAAADAYSETKKSSCATRLLNVLKDNGIRAVVLKGLAYKSLYPYPELRRMSDLDLFIPDGDLKRVYEVAQTIGNVESDEIHHFTIDKILNVETTASVYPDDDNSLFNEHLLNSEITDDSVCSFSFYNDELYTLTPTHNLLYCAYHMFKHFIFGGIGARQMCDFALLASKFSDEIDWSYILSQSERAKMTKFIFALMRIAEVYFGVDASKLYECSAQIVDDETAYEIWADMLEGGVFGVSAHEREIARSIVFRRIKERSSGEAQTGLRAAFPPLSYMRNELSYVDSMTFLLPIGWTHRICRFVFCRLFRRGEFKIVSKARKSADKRQKIMDKLDI